jgi:hypothetical protein
MQRRGRPDFLRNFLIVDLLFRKQNSSNAITALVPGVIPDLIRLFILKNTGPSLCPFLPARLLGRRCAETLKSIFKDLTRVVLPHRRGPIMSTRLP